jgi:hypothetical protein
MHWLKAEENSTKAFLKTFAMKEASKIFTTLKTIKKDFQ